MIKDLENCLEYCRQQNGMEMCKNCGLNQAMIDGIHQEQNTLLEQIKEEISKCKPYRNSNETFANPQLADGYKAGLEDTLSIIDKYINK